MRGDALSGYVGDAQAYAAATRALSLSPLWDLLESRIAPPARLLDVGCGGGRDLAHFATRGIQCIGVDSDSALARLAATHAGVPVLQGDLQALPIRQESFDAVWAVGLLHEVPPDVRARGFAEISRVLKTGGFLLASLRLAWHFKRRGDAREIHRTRPTEVRAMLQHAGLTLAALRVDHVASGPGAGRWLVVLAQRNCERDSDLPCSGRSPFTRISSDDQ